MKIGDTCLVTGSPPELQYNEVLYTNSCEGARKYSISQCKHHKVEVTKAGTYVSSR
jgi:hypothetical protein